MPSQISRLNIHSIANHEHQSSINTSNIKSKAFSMNKTNLILFYLAIQSRSWLSNRSCQWRPNTRSAQSSPWPPRRNRLIYHRRRHSTGISGATNNQLRSVFSRGRASKRPRPKTTTSRWPKSMCALAHRAATTHPCTTPMVVCSTVARSSDAHASIPRCGIESYSSTVSEIRQQQLHQQRHY